MSTHFEEQLLVFQAAGNVVIGRPETIIGNCALNEWSVGSKIVFGKNVTLCNTAIHFPLAGGELHIGDGVFLNAWIHAGPRSIISIGARTNFNRHSEVHAWEGASIEIGQDCLLSNIRIRTSDMHSIFDIETQERVNRSKSVSIGDKVWIGEFSIIGKGSRIDTGSVIGQCSFVSGYIPSHCIAVGQPARVVKSGIFWSSHLDMHDPIAMAPAKRPVEPKPSPLDAEGDFTSSLLAREISLQINQLNSIGILVANLIKTISSEIVKAQRTGECCAVEKVIENLQSSAELLRHSAAHDPLPTTYR